HAGRAPPGGDRRGGGGRAGWGRDDAVDQAQRIQGRRPGVSRDAIREARCAMDRFIEPNSRVRVARGIVTTVVRFRYPLIRLDRFAVSAASPSPTQASTGVISRRIGVWSAPNRVGIGVSVAPGTSTVTLTPLGASSWCTASPRVSTYALVAA